MTTQPGTRSFESLWLSALPSQYVALTSKATFADIARRLDTLGRVNLQTHEVFIEEHNFRDLLRIHLPAGVEEHCMLSLKAASADSFIITNSASGAMPQNIRPLSWQQLSQELRKLMKPPTIDDSQLGSSPTAESLIHMFKQHVPNIPDNLFDPKTFNDHLFIAIGATTASAETRLTNESEISSIWNCLVGDLGFWAALAVVTLVIVISSAIGAALVASGGTLGVAFWAAFWPVLAVAGAAGASFYLITVVLSCMGY